jgi:hypothetical protein
MADICVMPRTSRMPSNHALAPLHVQNDYNGRVRSVRFYARLALS